MSNFWGTAYEAIVESVIESLEQGAAERDLDGKTVRVDNETYQKLVEEIQVSHWMFWLPDGPPAILDQISITVTPQCSIFVRPDIEAPVIH